MPGGRLPCQSLLPALVLVTLMARTVHGVWTCTRTESENTYKCPGLDLVMDRALNQVVPDVAVSGDITYTGAFEEIVRLAGPSTKIYVVGGPVRDALRNQEPKDIDIAVTFDHDDVSSRKPPTAILGDLIEQRLAGGRGAVLAAPAPGKNRRFLLLLGKPDKGIDITNTKSNVEARNDWRDFTINALYYDWGARTVIDGSGKGLEDASLMRLRMTDEEEAWCPKAIRSSSGVNCPVKIQRYFHMRTKGFIPDRPTRRTVFRRLGAYLKRSSKTRDQFLKDFMFKLCKGTLSSNFGLLKRTRRYRALMNAYVEDSINEESTKLINMIIGVKGKRRAREQHAGSFHKLVTQNLFVADGRGCFVPRQGAVVAGVQCSVMTARDDDGRRTVEEMDLVTEDNAATFRYCPHGAGVFVDVGKCTWRQPRMLTEGGVVAIMQKPVTERTCDESIKRALALTEAWDDKTIRAIQSMGADCTLSDQAAWRERVSEWSEALAKGLWRYGGVQKVSRMVSYRLARHLHEMEQIEGRRLRFSPEVKIAGATGVIDEEGRIDWRVVARVVNEGNVREQLAFLWNFMRQRSVSRAVMSEDYRASAYALRRRTGLAMSCIVPEFRYDTCSGSDDVRTLRAPWLVLSYQCPDHPEVCNAVRARNSGKSTAEFNIDEVQPPPSNDELRTCQGSDGSLEWQIGAKVYSTTPDNQPSMVSTGEQQGFELQAESNGFTTQAGPSGSTGWILSFAQSTLGLSKPELKMLRLALIAFITPTSGHSLYEVMVGSEGFGMDMGVYDTVQWLSFLAEMHPSEVVLGDPPAVTVSAGRLVTKPSPAGRQDHHYTREGFTSFLTGVLKIKPYSFVLDGAGGEFARYMEEKLRQPVSGPADLAAVLETQAGIRHCRDLDRARVVARSAPELGDLGLAMMRVKKLLLRLEQLGEKYRHKIAAAADAAFEHCGAEGDVGCLAEFVNGQSLGFLRQGDGDYPAMLASAIGRLVATLKRLEFSGADEIEDGLAGCVGARNLVGVDITGDMLYTSNAASRVHDVLSTLAEGDQAVLPFEVDVGLTAAEQLVRDSTNAEEYSDAHLWRRGKDARARAAVAWYYTTEAGQSSAAQHGSLQEWEGEGGMESGVLLIWDSFTGQCLVRRSFAATFEAEWLSCAVLSPLPSSNDKTSEDPPAFTDDYVFVGRDTGWRLREAEVCGWHYDEGKLVLQAVFDHEVVSAEPVARGRHKVSWTDDSPTRALTIPEAQYAKGVSLFDDGLFPGAQADCNQGSFRWVPSTITGATLWMEGSSAGRRTFTCVPLPDQTIMERMNYREPSDIPRFARSKEVFSADINPASQVRDVQPVFTVSVPSMMQNGGGLSGGYDSDGEWS